MQQQLLNTPGDCQWLRDTALKNKKIDFQFNSFVLYGNEDAPDQVDLYAATDPLVTDVPFVVKFDDEDFNEGTLS